MQRETVCGVRTIHVASISCGYVAQHAVQQDLTHTKQYDKLYSAAISVDSTMARGFYFIYLLNLLNSSTSVIQIVTSKHKIK